MERPFSLWICRCEGHSASGRFEQRDSLPDDAAYAPKQMPETVAHHVIDLHSAE